MVGAQQDNVVAIASFGTLLMLRQLFGLLACS